MKPARKLSTTRLFYRQSTHLRYTELSLSHVFMGPLVQVRDLKRYEVSLVLKNVNLSNSQLAVDSPAVIIPFVFAPHSQRTVSADLNSRAQPITLADWQFPAILIYLPHPPTRASRQEGQVFGIFEVARGTESPPVEFGPGTDNNLDAMRRRTYKC